MTEEAKLKKAAYEKAYREKNRERLREYRRQWGRDNPDKVKEYNKTYWERKAAAAAGGE